MAIKGLIMKKTIDNILQQFIDDAMFLNNYLKVENLSNPDYDAKLTVKIGKRIEKNATYIIQNDGTEYKVASKPKAEVKTKEIKKPDNQPSLFDILDNTTQVTELEEIIENEVIEQEVENIPSTIIEVDDQKINTETGEVITQNDQFSAFDDEVTTSLFSIFENRLEVK